MQLGRPASPRPAQRMVSRFGLADTAGRFFLQVALDAGARCVLVRPVDRGIHAHLPRDQPGGVSPGLQRRQDQRPYTGALPAPEQAIDGLPAAIHGWDVTPRRTDTNPPADAVQELTFTPQWWAAGLLADGQQWFQDRPLRVGQVGSPRRR